MRCSAKLGIAFAVVVFGAGCASAPAPTLDLGERECTTRPELQRALVLSFEKLKERTADIDDTAPCLMAGPTDAKSAYSIFSLPSSAVLYVVSVTSAPLGEGLFSPRLLMLDETGNTLRELPRDTFQFHGASLYTSARVRPSERYLVVASDADSVGKSESQIAGSVQSAYVSGKAGGGYNVYTGSETTRTLIYAHNGKVTVTIKVLNTELPKPQ